MRTLYLILYIVAAVLFAVAFVAPHPAPTGTPSPVWTRFNLIALGLLSWVLVDVIQTADRLGD